MRQIHTVLLTTLLSVLASLAGAADDKTTPRAIAVIDFNYSDTSGEPRDQRREHETRLAAFMSALRSDLAQRGFRVVAPTCRPAPCALSDGRIPDLVAAARDAGADILLVGGIQKMSTLVQWAKVEAIDVRAERVVLDKLYTFRGDSDEAWQKAEAFIARQLAELSHP